ncbi:uncharacterized protein IUM83_19557 [Phytophthora cinnamomi]|uniref:uncharacterized protein n=1 Tax=Phytophthora cinnamomi TaxID=4785 RepID=UPI00355A2CEE|nr:hypothetical protein IUM83_19557 [Phytophthora cinnamomi]
MVRVVACRFMRISCSEDDHPLFRRYYARSNRERGIKLLRCFPHCCPEHVQRCYCGTSIHVLVTFESDPPPAAQGEAADAPGREVQDDTNERKLRPGEVVSLPESLLPSGNRKTKPATWIRADREGEAKQNTQNATLYVLNNHRFPKWLYSYDSSVTRTQREMTHHLVVYVCQVTGTRSQHGEIDAVVLARQESPGFSLISYRRSGNNASDAGCDLPAIEGASGSTFDAVDDDMSDMISSTMNDMEIDSGSSELYETKPPHSTHQPQYQVFSTQPKQEEMRQRVFSGGFLGSYRHQHEAAANPIRQVLPGPSSQDRYVWQVGSSARTCGFLDKGQHLLILWRFIQRLSLRDLGFDADAVHKEARTFWLRAAAAQCGQ